MIYEPKGKAREYCEAALNLFKGCPHGCTYCYVPGMPPWKFGGNTARQDFHARSIPRIEILSVLEKEAKKFRGKEVFLCFTCDPYPPDDPQMMARQVIKILHANEVKVRILTKSGARSERDFDLLAARPDLSFYGATLTFKYSDDSAIWEPNAAGPAERFMTLSKAHALGIPTWGSLEPVIDPKQTLGIIELMAPHVDMFKVGKWNHDKQADKIDWRTFAREAKALLESLNKQYYIKKDLAVYLP